MVGRASGLLGGNVAAVVAGVAVLFGGGVTAYAVSGGSPGGYSSSTGVVTVCASATAAGTTGADVTAPAHTVAVDAADVSTTPAVTVPGVTVPDVVADACGTATFTNATTTVVQTETQVVTETTTATQTTTVTQTVPAPVTANAWIDLDGGTCTTTATLGVYADSAACPTVQAALAAVSVMGGKVLVKCGTYPKQMLTQNGKAGTTTFSSESGRCATFDGAGGVALNLTNGVSYVTFDRVTVHGRVVGTLSTGLGNNHIGILNSDIDVGQKVNGPAIQFAVGDTISIVGNTIGPSCCGYNTGGTTGQSPEGIRIGKPSTAAASCTTQVCHLLIDDNLIQYAVRDCAYWPGSGFGTCPDTTCPNVVGCHADGIHLWGVDGATITRNRLYGDECQGIFLENTNNSLNRDVSIVNNAISTLPGGCSNKGIYLSAGGSTNGTSTGFAGHWTIAFNSGPSQLIVANGCGSCWPSMTVDVVGNDTIFFGTDLNGNNSTDPTCVTAWGRSTVAYRYNIWRPGGSDVKCDPTDLIASPAFVNAVTPPAVGIDLHLGASGAADGFVPASVCGPITSTDFDSDTRPAGAACDAGADDR